MTTESIEVGHVISDADMVEYMHLCAMADKLLQAHRTGTLGLIGERQRLMTQLEQIRRKETP